MPIKIIDDCISCGACQAECPNDAIYEGGVDWELKGETHPAKSDDHFYVATDKCTECVGFFRTNRSAHPYALRTAVRKTSRFRCRTTN